VLTKFNRAFASAKKNLFGGSELHRESPTYVHVNMSAKENTMKTNQHRGFTLVEVLIVVVIMAILAATIIPQFTNSTKDAQESTVLFNLQTFRSQIQMYRTQHDGKIPGATLSELTTSTNRAGTAGSGASYPYGPYLSGVPENTMNYSNSVKSITTSPAVVGDVTGTGGWLYNATTGEIWVDHSDHYTK
jgi:general secretion pathway protein G